MAGDSSSDVGAASPERKPLIWLSVLALVSAGLYGAVSFLSWSFDYHSSPADRPIVLVLLLLAAAFVLYLIAIRLAVRAAQDKRLVGVVLWSSLLFRATLLPSVPIQEIDIYRYLWDGAVTAAGVSPFRYSPQQARSAALSDGASSELDELVRLRESDPALAEILRRVHYGHLPTIYPPTSQAVFALSAWTTPADASVLGRVFVMKGWLLTFDMATLVVVLALLRTCRLPLGLSVAYAWCPLLLKEVANSGHLDTIAVCLTTAAVYLVARLLAKPSRASGKEAKQIWEAILAAAVLALAVGAKLYPVVLAPLLFLVLGRSIGWLRLCIPVSVFAALVFVVLFPMLPRDWSTADSQAESPSPASPPPVVADAASSQADPSLGVTTFLRTWEMNDFIFLITVENLKPTGDVPPQDVAWFSVVPESFRRQLHSKLAKRWGLDRREVPFLTARALTAATFVLLACYFAWRAVRSGDAASLCEAGFLTLAWFWLLCPTQNPWYWTWALPLLPFARSRAWLAVSGLVLVYYLRFWFIYHWPDATVWGTPYLGYGFFDFIVTWLEFGPWFVWLGVESVYHTWRSGASANAEGTTPAATTAGEPLQRPGRA